MNRSAVTPAAVRPAGQGKPLSRGINYLGNLRRILQDLTGFETLVFELMQNADDAKASTLAFDIAKGALVVDNNAVFSDCGDQDRSAAECLYLADRGHRCDFHSFREVASGDKRDRVDTTGAFGIGFIAVYQICDQAVLISANRRWDIDETRPENSRIMQTPAPDSAGTTFTLPWARDPNSPFRQQTGTTAVGPDDPQRLLEVLASTVPTAMLFLRHVREIELRRDGRTEARYRREDAGGLCEITGGGQTRAWLMLRGDFADGAADLRSRFPGKIEDRRRAEVTVAVPLDSDVSGKLCAYLPTDEPSGVPVHVNADFSPESDRKHLLTEGCHGEWNRLAVHAAARTLAERLPDLADALGHQRLWKLIFDAHQAHPAGPDTGIGAFWEELEPVLPTAPVMWTTAGEWTTPAGTVFLRSPEDEAEAVPVLEELGLAVMHPDVDSYARRMRGRAGARQLTAGILAEALLGCGLSDPLSPSDTSPAVVTAASRAILWREAERLLAQQAPSADVMLLGRAAIMPGTDGRLWPACDLQRTDAATADLFAVLGLDIALLDQTAFPAQCEQLAHLVAQLDLSSALRDLATEDALKALREALTSGRLKAAEVLTWVRHWEPDILASRELKSQVRALPIYPTGSGFTALNELMLPGDFTDRLGIAEVIDRDQVSEHVGFLQKIGAQPLTLRSYIIDSVPAAARRPDLVSGPRWTDLIVELAARIDSYAQDTDVWAALRPLPLVDCADETRPASECYFARADVTAVLGPGVPIARPVPGHEPSTTSLYEQLGVAREPRLPDVVGRVRQLATGEVTGESREAVGAVITYLAKVMRDRQAQLQSAVYPLRDLAWLPARGSTEWHSPGATNTVFRENLFATQGRFLDIPQRVQQDAADFLEWLGVITNPTPAQVTAHLLAFAGKGQPVARNVYTELSRHASDPAIGRLIGKKCLLLPGGRYVRPDEVFRQDNPFGRYRHLLGQEFDSVGTLLERLGVKRVPDHQDARAVLLDISQEARTRSHEPVDDEDDLAVIWQCWQILDSALSGGKAEPDWFGSLRDGPVVPNGSLVLTAPSRLLIDDMPGVADALNVGDAVIGRKEGMWRAFEAAGVRSLTEAVSIDIVSIDVTTSDGAVRRRILERRPTLARVVDQSPEGIERLDSTLGNLAFVESSTLTVRYRLPSFRLESGEVSLNALYIPVGRAEGHPAELISCPLSGGNWPWMLIAKELARALYPGQPPGPLASSLFVALNAESLAAAHRDLDDAGWPRVTHIDTAPPAAEPVPGFGSTSWPGADEPSYDDSVLDGPIPDGPGHGPGEGGSHPLSTVGAGASPSSDHGSREGDGDGGIGQSAGDGGPETPSGAGAGRPAGSGSRAVKHGRLRSYVMPDGESDAADGDGQRSAIDQAGVRRVLDYERRAGRYPNPMPHENPGYDVESFDQEDRLVRHIEVKSTAGAWDDMGVGLTRRQFEFALEHPATFWLYVVEFALDDENAKVSPIPDPIGQADEFRFDSGWSAISEATGASAP